MIYRKLDQNGDYVFGGNGSCYISGLNAVKQAILTRLRLLLGEWWEDETDGLPLWQKILAARDKKEAERQILNRISPCSGHNQLSDRMEWGHPEAEHPCGICLGLRRWDPG